MTRTPDDTAGAGPRPSTTRSRAILGLLLVVPAQGLGVWAMLFAFPGPSGKVLSGVSRLWMLGVPIAWTVLVERRRPALARPTRRGLAEGIGTGLVMLAVIVASYRLAGHAIDLDALRARAAAIGLDRPIPFALLFAYIVVVNALLEEYVWRWFVVRQVERALPPSLRPGPARAATVGLAAALFTVHHVIALAAWVGPPLIALGSLGVFLAALVWSALASRHRSLWPSYASHILADLGILAIAADLLFRAPGG